MAVPETRYFSQGGSAYLFTISILKVSHIPSPVRSSVRSSFSSLSGALAESRKTLKITILHGPKQKEIGEFDIIQDSCIINQKISCKLYCMRPDDLGKLHIYIDQAYNSGLAGHVAIDLKEFLDELDSEIYIKYPLSASSPRPGHAPKLKLVLTCTSLGPNEDFHDFDRIIHHQHRPVIEPWEDDCVTSKVEETLWPPSVNANKIEDNEKQLLSGEDHIPEIHLLEELETVLLKLDTKLKTFVATYKDTGYPGHIVDDSEHLKHDGVGGSDCFVCKQGLDDKESLLGSSGLKSKSNSFSTNESRCSSEINCSSEKIDTSMVQEDELEEHPTPTTKRPNCFKHILGGVLFVGASILAITAVRKQHKLRTADRDSHQQ